MKDINRLTKLISKILICIIIIPTGIYIDSIGSQLVRGILAVSVVIIFSVYLTELFDFCGDKISEYFRNRKNKRNRLKIEKLEIQALLVERQMAEVVQKKDLLFKSYQLKFKPESKDTDSYNEELLIKMLHHLDLLDRLTDTLQLLKERIHQDIVFQTQALTLNIELVLNETQIDRILQTIQTHDALEDVVPNI